MVGDGYYPGAAQTWPDLATERRAELIDLYRDSGHLPTIASAVAGMPVMPD